MTDAKDIFKTVVVYGTGAVAVLYVLFKLFALVDSGALGAEVVIPIIASVVTAVLAFLFNAQSNREAVHLANPTPGPVQVGPENANVTVTSEPAKPVKDEPVFEGQP